MVVTSTPTSHRKSVEKLARGRRGRCEESASRTPTFKWRLFQRPSRHSGTTSRARRRSSAHDLRAGPSLSDTIWWMRRILAGGLVLCLSVVSACAPAGAPEAGLSPATTPRPVRSSAGSLTTEIQRVLDAIRAADAGQLAVSEEDGRFLRVLVAASGARSILEIGGASGYSGIWLGLGARATGGRVVSIEYDAARAKAARANIDRSGLGDVVRAVEGDAFAEIPRLVGEFDLVFLDAWKPDYVKFFEMIYPRLSPGAVFVAHNVVNKQDDMRPFLEAIKAHPGLFTTIVSPSGEGMSVSYKR